jgi:hypothetical protein
MRVYVSCILPHTSVSTSLHALARLLLCAGRGCERVTRIRILPVLTSHAAPNRDKAACKGCTQLP